MSNATVGSEQITHLIVSFTAEQWRRGSNTTQRAETWFAGYATKTSAFTSGDPFVPAAVPPTSTTAPAPIGTQGPTFNFPVTTPPAATWSTAPVLNFTTPNASLATAATLDGNDPANQVVVTQVLTLPVALGPGHEIMLVWGDSNSSGNDHGMAIDDLKVYAIYNGPAGPAVALRTLDTTAPVTPRLAALFGPAGGTFAVPMPSVIAAPPTLPAATTFPLGLFDYSVTGFAGSSATVRIRVEPTFSPSNFYKYDGLAYTPFPTSGLNAAVYNAATSEYAVTIEDNGAFDIDPAAGMVRDPGGPGQGGTLAVSLASLSATAAYAGAPVTIEWTTSAELDNAGFVVKNATTGATIGSFVPAEGSATTGASYSVVDPAGLAADEVRAYVVEDIDLSGTVTVNGPVTATITGGASAVSGWNQY